jgi:hypothetical protein
MSLGLNQSLLSAGGNKLLPDIDSNLKSWCTTPTTDGKTLSNIQGSSVNLRNINCLNFDGADDRIALQTVPSDLLQGVFNIEFDILIDDTDTSYQRVLWFLTSGNAFFRIQKNVNANSFDFWARNSSSGNVFRNQGLAFTPDVLFNFKAIGNGTDVKVYYNDVLQSTISINNSNKESGFAPPSPTIGSNSFAFLGKLSNFKMSSGGVLHTHLPLAEGYGTKAYDVSGNGNHGTITSATWTTFNGIESWNHEYGFDSSAVFDGTDDRIDTGLADTTAVTKASFTIKPENDGTNRVILGIRNKVGDGNASTYIDTSNKLRYKARTSGTNLANRCDTTVLTAGNTYDVVIEYGAADGTGTSVTINGVTQSFTAVNGINQSGGDLLIGAAEHGSVGNFYQGEIYSLKLETSSGVIRDFVPSDNKLFDKVNNTFYTNGGSGAITTKRYPALNTKTTQVATLDGVNDEINTNYNPAQDLVIECRFRLNTFSGQRVIHSCNGNTGYFFRVENGEFQLYAGNGYVFNGSADFSADSTTEIYDTRVELIDSTNTWTAYAKTSTQSEYTLLGTGTRTPNFIQANVIIGQKGGSHHLDGEIHSFKLTSNGVTKVEYDFSGNLGTSTVLDISGNQNGTAHNVSTDLFWGKRIADTAGSLVNADYAAGKTTISNLGGLVHNSSECGFETGLQELTSTQIFAIDNTGNQLFTRKAGTEITQFLEYEAGLTGTDLTRTRNYAG